MELVVQTGVLYCLFPLFFYLNTYSYKTGHVRHTSLFERQLIETKLGRGAKIREHMSKAHWTLGVCQVTIALPCEIKWWIKVGFLTFHQEGLRIISSGRVIYIRYLTVPEHIWLLLNTSSSIKQNKLWFSNNLLFVYVLTNYIASML